MSYHIAIASGKGGTGKTSLTYYLYHLLISKLSGNTLLVDCDVEEPNLSLFFQDASCRKSIILNQDIPVLDHKKCNFCRKCVEYCEFNALLMVPSLKYAEVQTDLCHGCGACIYVCPDGALTSKPSPIGKINYLQTNYHQLLMEGELKIGSAMQTMVIRKLKKDAELQHADTVLFDAPPGSSCPVVESVIDADYVILVTEPTPFGLHDLQLAVDLVREMKLNFGVVINKSSMEEENDLKQYLKEEDIDLIGEIPFSKSFAINYAQAKLNTEMEASVSEAYTLIGNHVLDLIHHERDCSIKR